MGETTGEHDRVDGADRRVAVPEQLAPPAEAFGGQDDIISGGDASGDGGCYGGYIYAWRYSGNAPETRRLKRRSINCARQKLEYVGSATQ